VIDALSREGEKEGGYGMVGRWREEHGRRAASRGQRYLYGIRISCTGFAFDSFSVSVKRDSDSIDHEASLGLVDREEKK
jgi:hypothetical protein